MGCTRSCLIAQLMASRLPLKWGTNEPPTTTGKETLVTSPLETPASVSSFLMLYLCPLWFKGGHGKKTVLNVKTISLNESIILSVALPFPRLIAGGLCPSLSWLSIPTDGHFSWAWFTRVVYGETIWQRDQEVPQLLAFYITFSTRWHPCCFVSVPVLKYKLVVPSYTRKHAIFWMNMVLYVSIIAWNINSSTYEWMRWMINHFHWCVDVDSWLKLALYTYPPVKCVYT